MPTYLCRVLAFFDDDLLELGDFPYELESHHDPQAGFICLLDRELAVTTGHSGADISTVLADEPLRDALADRVGLAATRWLATRGGIGSLETAQGEMRRALASWRAGVAPPAWYRSDGRRERAVDGAKTLENRPSPSGGA